MADQERDARLILRAEDRASQTFKQVEQSVQGVTAKLVEQATAAARGEGSIKDLTEAQKALQRAGDDLVKQQSAIKAFEKAGTSATAAAERVTKAQQAYDTYKAKLDEAGKTTEAQAARLEKLGTAVDRNQVALDKQNARLDAARDRLTAFGLSSENTQKQFGEIGDTARQVAQGLVTATTAVEGFAAAERDAAAQAVEAEKRRQNAIKTTTALLEQRIAEEAKTVANQGVASASAVRSGNLNRFSPDAAPRQIGLTDLASSIRAIIMPANAEIQTLQGALAAIDASAETAASKQKLRVSQYQDSLNSLSQASRALVLQATQIDAFNRQTVAVDKLDAELGRAATRSQELAQAILKAKGPTDELTAELKKADVELERVGAQALAARAKFVELSDGLKRVGIDANNLPAEYARIAKGAETAGAANARLTEAVGGGGKGFLGLKPYELQNLSFQINDVFTSLGSGASPLRVIAQQGGQIGQIFTGFNEAIVKVFQTIVTNLPIILPLAAVFGGIAYQLYEVKKAADATRGFEDLFRLSSDAAGLSAKQFGAAQVELERLGASAKDAKTILTDFINQGLNPAGLDTFIETVKQIAKATGEDIPTAAKQYADALSGGYDAVTKLNDVTHTLTDAQLDQIKAFFDAGEADKARTLVAELYRAKAQEIADKSQSEWSRATKGLGQAFGDLNTSLGSTRIFTTIAKNALAELTDDVNTFRKAVEFARQAYAFIANARAASQGGGFVSPVAAPAPKANGNPAATDGRTRTSGTTGGRAFLDEQQTELRRARQLTQPERLDVAGADAANRAAAAGANQAEIAQARLNARKIEQGRIDKENEAAAKRQESAANKAERAAEAAARKAEERQQRIANLSKDLENTYTALGANREDDPFVAIQKKAEITVRDIRAKFAQLAKLGITTVDGKTLADYEAAVRAQTTLLTQQAQQKQNEEDVNKLLDQRKSRLAEIEDKVANGSLSPVAAVDAAAAVTSDLNPKIQTAAQAALKFAQALEAAKPDPKTEAFIAKVQKILTEASGNGALIEIGLKDLKTAQAGLDALVSKRDALVQVQKVLAKTGNETSADAQRNIDKAFKDSRPAIVAAASAVQTLIDKLLDVPGLPPETIASLQSAKAKTLEVVAGTKHLTDEQVALRNAAESALAGSISSFLDTLGTTIGNVLNGTSSLKDALSDIGNAALSFAASFTKAIAQAIIQLIALKIAKAALNSISFLGGGFHGGGVIGSDAPTFKREISPLAFAGAVRYHTGGLVGLQPDEVPAILQKGEEVITRNDPRNRLNGGGGASSGPAAPVVVKNVNLFDAGEAVSAGANTRVGEQSILNVIGRNPAAVKAKLGIS